MNAFTANGTPINRGDTALILLAKELAANSSDNEWNSKMERAVQRFGQLTDSQRESLLGQVERNGGEFKSEDTDRIIASNSEAPVKPPANADVAAAAANAKAITRPSSAAVAAVALLDRPIPLYAIGKIFGALRIVKVNPRSNKGFSYMLLCKCGNEIRNAESELKGANPKSCGWACPFYAGYRPAPSKKEIASRQKHKPAPAKPTVSNVVNEATVTLTPRAWQDRFHMLSAYAILASCVAVFIKFLFS